MKTYQKTEKRASSMEYDKIKFTIYGEPASKANSRKIVRKSGSPRVIKSRKALSYVRTAILQIPQLPVLIECDVCISIKIYYATQRPDLDESIILDLIQGKIYKNDRQIKEKHIYHFLSKENPRSEIEIMRIK